MINERILIFGNGQVGNLYLNYFQTQDTPVEIARVDITDKEQIETAVEAFKPSVIVNTAAKTNLEYCGNHKLEAFNVNVLGADNLAQVCAEKDIYFIHFSSGCIFQSQDENDAKREEDKPDPQAYYSWTKVWAEQLIPWQKPEGFKYVILRPRQPISGNLSHKNMLVKMLTFQRWIETPNTGTVLEDMLEWTTTIIEKKPVGVYHLANPGWMTPYEIGLMLKEIINPAMELEKISKQDLDKIMPNRRVDTVLNVDKLKTLGIEPKPYRERMRDTILKLKQNIAEADPSYLKQVLEQTAAETAQRSVVNDVWQKLLK